MAIFSLGSKKDKKTAEPQYVKSAINNTVLNYNVYTMTAVEWIFYTVAAIVVGGAVGLVFYGGLFKDGGGLATTATFISNIVVFCLVGLIAAKLFIPMRTEQLKEKRKKKLCLQARDMLESLSASLSSGQVMQTAFESAYNDLRLQYGPDAFIVAELNEILQGMNHNIPAEELLRDFGTRSGNEDILNFSDVFAVCLRRGGDLKEVVRRTYSVISDKMAISDEIETKLTSNKTQQKFMNGMPVVLVAVLRLTNESFAINFATPTGVLSITVALAIFYGAYRYGEKIVDIK